MSTPARRITGRTPRSAGDACAGLWWSGLWSPDGRLPRPSVSSHRRSVRDPIALRPQCESRAARQRSFRHSGEADAACRRDDAVSRRRHPGAQPRREAPRRRTRRPGTEIAMGKSQLGRARNQRLSERRCWGCGPWVSTCSACRYSSSSSFGSWGSCDPEEATAAMKKLSGRRTPQWAGSTLLARLRASGRDAWRRAPVGRVLRRGASHRRRRHGGRSDGDLGERRRRTSRSRRRSGHTSRLRRRSALAAGCCGPTSRREPGAATLRGGIRRAAAPWGVPPERDTAGDLPPGPGRRLAASHTRASGSAGVAARRGSERHGRPRRSVAIRARA